MPAGTASPLRLSWSQIRTHEECHAKRHLQQTGKRSGVSDIRMFFRGTVVDRCMRDWLNADEQIPGAMAGMVEDKMGAEEEEARQSGDGVVRWRHSNDRNESVEWCRNLCTRLEPLLFKYVVPYQYEPAVRFRAPLTVPHPDGGKRQIELVGEMDLLTRNDEMAFRVWDLKATENDQYWRKVTGQLVFYEIAVYLLHNSWPFQSGLLQPLCKEPAIAFTFSQQDRNDMFYRITKVATDIWREDRTPHPGSWCGQCDVRHACPVYKTAPGSGRMAAWA